MKPLIAIGIMAHRHFFGYCVKADLALKIAPPIFRIDFILWSNLEFLIETPFFHIHFFVNPHDHE
jgi:hypothetical protein